jgi:hypothetical protein
MSGSGMERGEMQARDVGLVADCLQPRHPALGPRSRMSRIGIDSGRKRALWPILIQAVRVGLRTGLPWRMLPGAL